MRKPHGSYVDVKPPARIMLSLLWTSMLFVFAYVDIFGFWRSDVIKGAAGQEGPGAGVRDRSAIPAADYDLHPDPSADNHRDDADAGPDHPNGPSHRSPSRAVPGARNCLFGIPLNGHPDRRIVEHIGGSARGY
jgi:hypothetical protein